MNQPYFIQPVNTSNIISYDTILWDDILSVWHISSEISSAGDAIYAYCAKSDIDQCSNKWHAFEGIDSGYHLDDIITSGNCSSYVNIVL